MSLYGFEGRCFNIISRFCTMDFEPCFKVNKLVSVHHKSTKLGQMFIDLPIDYLKKTRLSPLRNSGIACSRPQRPRSFWNRDLWGRGLELSNGVRAWEQGYFPWSSCNDSSLQVLKDANDHNGLNSYYDLTEVGRTSKIAVRRNDYTATIKVRSTNLIWFEEMNSPTLRGRSLITHHASVEISICRISRA